MVTVEGEMSGVSWRDARQAADKCEVMTKSKSIIKTCCKVILLVVFYFVVWNTLSCIVIIPLHSESSDLSPGQ
jgi:hypothetical protein